MDARFYIEGLKSAAINQSINLWMQTNRKWTWLREFVLVMLSDRLFTNYIVDSSKHLPTPS